MSDKGSKAKVSAWAWSCAILCSLSLVVGCGVSSAGPTPITPPSGGNTGTPAGTGQTGSNTGSGSGSGEQTGGQGGSSAPSSSPVALTTEHLGQIQVDVPAAWTKTAIGGTGDWGGFRFTNPKDPKEQVEVVSSACVGCYTDASGKPNPTQVIPSQDATDVVVSNDGLTATYKVPQSGNAYGGQGIVSVSANGNGYGYLKVTLSSQDSELGSKLVQSFQFSG